ncbi:AcrR family transcriptional regulator [Litorivivens lipolytica]|uniref:AcrR family transcriptional regulator n=1 Tax=Litorivivens lipolytica TaxID=1524264 RepID=A0A7W4W4E1_9GAMM|nr:TetR/AcrR family transcriptional regulator [Litorivivens lipolytica]MBB3047256.1 AcrR family transcriptional regulator [Litorivivens lipolytica]
MGSRRWGNGARVDDVDTGKKKLLRAAITCFVSKGVQSTTIEDVANAANVTRRTVYRYYAGKSELIAAVIDLERKRLFDQLTTACAPYQNDFARMVEEALVCSAEVLSPVRGSQDLLSSNNAGEILSHLTGELAREQWQKLFQDAYLDYRRRNPDAGALHDILDMVSRIALSFRYMPAEAEDVRRAVQSLFAVARRRSTANLRLV